MSSAHTNTTPKSDCYCSLSEPLRVPMAWIIAAILLALLHFRL